MNENPPIETPALDIQSLAWLKQSGLLPAIVFAINTATGSIYNGLWFPAIATAIAAVVTFFFWPETKDRDIHA